MLPGHKSYCNSFILITFLLYMVTFAFKALVSDAAEDAKADVSLILPPCHEDADKPEDVYRFDDRIFWGHRIFFVPIQIDPNIRGKRMGVSLKGRMVVKLYIVNANGKILDLAMNI